MGLIVGSKMNAEPFARCIFAGFCFVFLERLSEKCDAGFCRCLNAGVLAFI